MNSGLVGIIVLLLALGTISALLIKLAMCPKATFHYWLQVDSAAFVMPKIGPFDPRSDQERTCRTATEICAHCGQKRPRYDDGDFTGV